MLILVRHGRTALNAAGQLQGRLDADLDDLGQWQAARLAGVLGGMSAVVSSPLARARQTAAAIAQGHPIQVDERWTELDYGDLDGRRITDIGGETWHRWRTDADFEPPGGESLAALDRRVRSACEQLCQRATEGDVVVVSHVSPIKAAVCWAVGTDVSMSWRVRLDTASITRIGIGPRGPMLYSFNETLHLLDPPAEG